MRCQECEERTGNLYDDPRQPPLFSAPCLCAECFKYFVDEVIEELRDQINDLNKAKRQIQ